MTLTNVSVRVFNLEVCSGGASFFVFGLASPFLPPPPFLNVGVHLQIRHVPLVEESDHPHGSTDGPGTCLPYIQANKNPEPP